MASIFGILNRLLPFATPGTPVLQDIVHLAAICAVLYFGPQIQERFQQQRQSAREGDHDHQAAEGHRDPAADGGSEGNEREANAEVDEEQAVNEDAADVADVNEQRPDPDVEQVQEGQPGPARPPVIPEQRNVGAKKAKALARRDQRRAYNEFQRSQGDAQRARDAEGAEEREKAQAAERERRKAAEAALEAKKAKERENRRAKEEAQRLEEQRRREQAVEIVRNRLETDRMCNLFKVAREVGVDDEEWVERILRSSGMLGRRGDTLTMITGMGWAVQVSAADMKRVYATIMADETASEPDGQIEADLLGATLERSLRCASVTVTNQ